MRGDEEEDRKKCKSSKRRNPLRERRKKKFSKAMNSRTDGTEWISVVVGC